MTQKCWISWEDWPLLSCVDHSVVCFSVCAVALGAGPHRPGGGLSAVGSSAPRGRGRDGFRERETEVWLQRGEGLLQRLVKNRLWQCIYLYISPSAACVCLRTGSGAWRAITWHDDTHPDALVLGFTEIRPHRDSVILYYCLKDVDVFLYLFVWMFRNLGATWGCILTCLHDVMSQTGSAFWEKTSLQLHPAGRESYARQDVQRFDFSV